MDLVLQLTSWFPIFSTTPHFEVYQKHTSLKKVSWTILHLKLHLEGTEEDTRLKLYKIKHSRSLFSGRPFFHNCWARYNFHQRSSVLFLPPHILKMLFLVQSSLRKKRWLIDSQSNPENTNYDIKWKCSFFLV